MTTTIVKRATKGSALTWDEMDANFENLKVTADAACPIAGPGSAQTFATGDLSVTNDINLLGTGGRVTGDFSNSTLSSRVYFQTSTINGNSNFGILPNGTSQTSNFFVYNAADPTNAAYGTVRINSSSVALISTAAGSGTGLPLTMITVSTGSTTVERVRVNIGNGNVQIGAVGAAESAGAEKLQITGSLGIVGTGHKITGDFSNATGTNKLAFQSSTTDGNTILSTVPNGASAISGIDVYSAIDPDNASYGSLTVNGSVEVSIDSGANGTGTIRPLTFKIDATEKARLDTDGALLVGTSTNDGVSKLQVAGSVNISGTGSRITGDCSTSTLINRLAIQSSVANGVTAFSVLPNGTATTSAIRAYNASDPTNAANTNLTTSPGLSSIIATANGSGTGLPLSFHTVSTGTTAVERMRICIGTGHVLINTPTDDTFNQLQVNGDTKTNRIIEVVSALTPSATISLDASLGSYFILTPDQTCQINATGAKAGQSVSLAITTSGTSSFTLTFGTNFKTTGTLATGPLTAKVFVINFSCFDGITYVETGRTTAM